MRTIIASLLCGVLLGISANVFAQNVEIGMTKQQLAKSFPHYDTAFKTAKQFTNVENFPLHGLLGLAIFRFSNDRLVFFDWTYPNDYHPGSMFMMQPQEVSKYRKLVRDLQSEYGPGSASPSPYNPDAMNCHWSSAKYSGSLRYSVLQAKFQLSASR